MREISIGENYERNITPIRSDISRFSRGTDRRFGFRCTPLDIPSDNNQHQPGKETQEHKSNYLVGP